MNLFDDLPDLPPCPHCGHDGDGLNWAFPMEGEGKTAMCACLACGAHGPAHETYEAAIAAFSAGELAERS